MFRFPSVAILSLALTVALLLTACPQSVLAAQWVKVSSNKDSSVFIDNDSIHPFKDSSKEANSYSVRPQEPGTELNTWRFWTKWLYTAKPQQSPKTPSAPRIVYTLTLYQLDCQAKTLAKVQSHDYAANGKPVGDNDKPYSLDISYIYPESAGEVLWKAVCNPKTQTDSQRAIVDQHRDFLTLTGKEAYQIEQQDPKNQEVNKLVEKVINHDPEIEKLSKEMDKDKLEWQKTQLAFTDPELTQTFEKIQQLENSLAGQGLSSQPEALKLWQQALARYETLLQKQHPLNYDNAFELIALYETGRIPTIESPDVSMPVNKSLAADWFDKIAVQIHKNPNAVEPDTLLKAIMRLIDMAHYNDTKLPTWLSTVYNAYKNEVNGSQNDVPYVLAHLMEHCDCQMKGSYGKLARQILVDNLAPEDGSSPEPTVEQEALAWLAFQGAYAKFQGCGTFYAPAEGIRYLEIALENGHTLATYLLGHAYEVGRYVPMDSNKAKQVYKDAAELGSPEAAYRLAELSADKDNVQAFRWFRRAAELGHVDSIYEVGKRLYWGIGIEESKPQAYVWLTLADLRGRQLDTQTSPSDTPFILRDECLLQMTPTEIRQAQEWLIGWNIKVPSLASQGKYLETKYEPKEFFGETGGS